MNLILKPEEISVETAGGKGAALHRLSEAGFDVPAFCVVSPQACHWQDDCVVAQPELAAELQEALERLGPGPYAVRSSGRAEDGSAHSHAGQFHTGLDIPAPEVEAAIRDVWASGFSDSLASYRAATHAAPAEAPAIIVQQMVPARAAGVAFSADPVSGFQGCRVISAVEGLGEALVSGAADGEDWQVSETGELLVTPAEPQVLTQEEAQKIATLATRAEEVFGRPQDIEWALDGARLYMLQSRPITTLLRPRPMPDGALVVLDNSNIVESYPGIVSPLTYSFACYVYNRVYRAFVALLGVRPAEISANTPVFDNLLTRVDGRVYYNLGNWYRTLALLPGFSRNRDHMETMMGVDEPLPAELRDSIGPPPATGLKRFIETLRTTRVAMGLFWAALRLPATKRRFLTRLERALATGTPPERANLTELAATWRTIEADLLDRWDAPLVNDFLCMMAFGGSRKLLEKWAGPAGLSLHNDVMIGQGDIVSAEPSQRIAEMGRMVAAAGLANALLQDGRVALAGQPEIEAAFTAYLERFGDRCTQELKLESIPLDEDPSQLLAAIAASANRSAKATAERSEPDWEAAIPGRPVRRQLARWATVYAKARVRDRENLRFERTRIFGHARRVFLAMGREFWANGRLDAPRDIFHLTVGEVLGAIEGNALSTDLRAIVSARKAEQDHNARLPDPPERLIGRGAALLVRAGPAQAKPEETGDARIGTGCSAGRVTAPARVIRDPRSEHLVAGEILVARNTDPGWIAVFSNAAAIVVERGSLLSHSAIVARELGIPCVVGIKGATDWVPEGAWLTVDGESGEVRLGHDTQ
ncbi:PEP/pyruvate-binding domain-containing protein [Aliiruegeria lutimaris]|uniref:Pyruvate, water dikinase n=1 Tax=Aliiruegeria lutimaris TaxID=571298 RepID=A0A1G8MQ74_9RHOB|nr:PEP/pyruvate-binding domain-containing protein [Aliiruegeria lutimaris]SDI70121.1 pyruvate, water dikinase [Aliiruegeria lutimaris]